MNLALEQAIAAGHMDLAVSLILFYEGEDEYDLDTALDIAARDNHVEIVKYLLALHANPNFGLLSAAENGYLDIVKLLVESGAEDLDSALELALHYRHKDVAEYLESII